MKARGYGLISGLVVGLSLVLQPLAANEASAQIDVDAENCGIAIFCQATDSESSGGNANGGRGGDGGNGGFASVHDIANAHADASSSVTIDDITTGDAFGHDIDVDATGANAPVVLAIAGSFSDTGVDVLAPGGNAQSGTTGGNGLSADASGGDGGEGGDATGGRGGAIDSDQGLGILAGDLIPIIDIINAP